MILIDVETEQKKEYLKSYRRARAEVRAIRESIEELRLSKMCPSMGVQDGMPHGSGGSDLSGYAARLDALERKLQDKQDMAAKLMIAITRDIDAMEDQTERTLLRYRYICGYTWERIADEMGYSWQWTHKIHAKALKHFEMSEKRR